MVPDGVCLCACGVNGHRGVCTGRDHVTVLFHDKPGGPVPLEVCRPCAERLVRDKPYPVTIEELAQVAGSNYTAMRQGDVCGECPIPECDAVVTLIRCDKVVTSLGGRLFAIWGGRCAAGHLCSLAVMITTGDGAAPATEQ